MTLTCIPTKTLSRHGEPNLLDQQGLHSKLALDRCRMMLLGSPPCKKDVMDFENENVYWKILRLSAEKNDLTISHEEYNMLLTIINHLDT